MHSENQTGAIRIPLSSQRPRVFRITFYQTNARLSSTKVAALEKATSEIQKPKLSKAKRATILVKMSLICMRMKNHFHIKGWGLKLVLMTESPGELGNGLFGNTSVWQGWGYLSSLRGCKLQIFGIILGRVCAGRVYYKFIGSQVSLLRTVLKGIKKAKEERWKERRAKHSVTASLPELKLLQLSCAGCLWSFKAWVSPRLLFFWDLSEFTLFWD